MISGQTVDYVEELQRTEPIFSTLRPGELKPTDSPQIEFTKVKVDWYKGWLNYGRHIAQLSAGEAVQEFPKDLTCEDFVRRISEFRYDKITSVLLRLRDALKAKNVDELCTMFSLDPLYAKPMEIIRLIPFFMDNLITAEFSIRVCGQECRAQLQAVIHEMLLKPLLLDYIGFHTTGQALQLASTLQDIGNFDKTDKEAWRACLRRFAIDPNYVFLERNQNTRVIRPFCSARASFITALKSCDEQPIRDLLNAIFPVLFERQLELTAAHGIRLGPYEDKHVVAAIASLIIDVPELNREIVVLAEYIRVFAMDLYCVPDGLSLLLGPTVPVV